MDKKFSELCILNLERTGAEFRKELMTENIITKCHDT